MFQGTNNPNHVAYVTRKETFETSPWKKAWIMWFWSKDYLPTSSLPYSIDLFKLIKFSLCLISFVYLSEVLPLLAVMILVGRRCLGIVGQALLLIIGVLGWWVVNDP